MWPFKKNKELELLNKEIESTWFSKEGTASSNNVNFLLILLKDSTDIKATNKSLSNIMNDIMKNNCTIITTMPSLLFAAYGIDNVAVCDGADLKRKKLVNELMSNYSNEISIIHGEKKGLTGLFGNESMKCYSTLLPNFKDILKELSSLNIGEMKEI